MLVQISADVMFAVHPKSDPFTGPSSIVHGGEISWRIAFLLQVGMRVMGCQLIELCPRGPHMERSESKSQGIRQAPVTSVQAAKVWLYGTRCWGARHRLGVAAPFSGGYLSWGSASANEPPAAHRRPCELGHGGPGALPGRPGRNGGGRGVKFSGPLICA